MSTGTPMPWLKSQWTKTDANGYQVPADGYQLFTYQAGTSTKQATYTSSDMSAANTNPIILDSAGRADVFFDPSLTYKVVLATDTDTDPPASPVFVEDNIQAIPLADSALDFTGTAGETVAAGNCVYLSDGSGSTNAGQWYKADASNTYSSTAAPSIAFVATGGDAAETITVRQGGRVTGLTGLTEGSIYYVSETAAAITLTPPTNAMPVGVADSTTSLVVWVTPPNTDGTVKGLVSTAAQTIAGVKTFSSGPLVTASGISAKVPVLLSCGYSGLATTTPSLSITANTLAANGDAVIVEWETDYASATLSARITIDGTNTDFGAGSGTTEMHARVVISRIGATSVCIDGKAVQGTVTTTSHGTQVVSDLAANAFAITAGMASGTYTIRGYRILFVPAVAAI